MSHQCLVRKIDMFVFTRDARFCTYGVTCVQHEIKASSASISSGCAESKISMQRLNVTLRKLNRLRSTKTKKLLNQ